MQRHTVIKLWMFGFIILPVLSGVVGARYCKVAVDKVRAYVNPPQLTVETLLKSSRLPLPVLPVDEPEEFRPVNLNGHAFNASSPISANVAADELPELPAIKHTVKLQRVAVTPAVKVKPRRVAEVKRTSPARHKKLQQPTTTAALAPG